MYRVVYQYTRGPLMFFEDKRGFHRRQIHRHFHKLHRVQAFTNDIEHSGDFELVDVYTGSARQGFRPLGEGLAQTE